VDNSSKRIGELGLSGGGLRATRIGTDLWKLNPIRDTSLVWSHADRPLAGRPTIGSAMSDVSFAAAFGGGLVSFFSPCVLPIVPGYLSMVSGLTVAEVREGSRQHLARIAATTALFIAGFSLVFTLLGLGIGSVGDALFEHQVLLTRISGALVLVMAVYIAGSALLMRPGLYREFRFHPQTARFGPFAAPIAGAAFGFGWTPCLGPVLGAILNLALIEGSPGRAAFLMAFYSAGLGIPFLAAGLAFGRLARLFAWVKRHFQAITFASAAVLGAFGVVLMLNRFAWFTQQVASALDSIGLGRLQTLG
jgi:cytochrome c-type biogenesis protein